MDERVSSNEGERDPVEVSFGSVVNFVSGSKAGNGQSYLVFSPTDPEFIEAVRIVRDDEENPEVNSRTGGTEIHPLTVIGSWPLEKVIAAYVNGSVITSPEYQKEIAAELTRKSQMRPVMYTGRLRTQ